MVFLRKMVVRVENIMGYDFEGRLFPERWLPFGNQWEPHDLGLVNPSSWPRHHQDGRDMENWGWLEHHQDNKEPWIHTKTGNITEETPTWDTNMNVRVSTLIGPDKQWDEDQVRRWEQPQAQSAYSESLSQWQKNPIRWYGHTQKMELPRSDRSTTA